MERDKALYVIVRWEELGIVQMRLDDPIVFKWLKEHSEVEILTPPLPREEAAALMSLYPKELRHYL